MAVRVLCIHGENDPRPGSLVQRFSDRLSQGVFLSIADCGHYLWLGQPQELGRRLQHFLMYERRE